MPKKVIGNTQGKKGQKLSRINMAFSDENLEYVTKKAAMLGVSKTAFVNALIDAQREG